MSNKKKYITPELRVDTYEVEMGFALSINNTTAMDQYFDQYNMERWTYGENTDLDGGNGNGWSWQMN